MKPLYSLLILILIYISVIGVGLYVGFDLIQKIESDVIEPVVAEPESAESSAYIFVYIIIMTVILLILLKLGLDVIIRVLMMVAMFMGLFLTFWSFFGGYALLLAVILIIYNVLRKQDIIMMDVTLALTISGIGAFLGASLAVLPSFLLLLIIAIYDLVAVFGTKHMVMLAEKAKGKFPFMFLIPIRDTQMGLGTGDLALPLTFTVSVLRDYTLSNALLTAAGGLIGLLTLFFYVINRKHVTLPALPPIVIGLFLGFFISLLI